ERGHYIAQVVGCPERVGYYLARFVQRFMPVECALLRIAAVEVMLARFGASFAVKRIERHRFSPCSPQKPTPLLSDPEPRGAIRSAFRRWAEPPPPTREVRTSADRRHRFG